MKRNWLIYLVIFSLALNLGTIGTIVYLRYQDHRQPFAGSGPPPLPMKSLWRESNLDIPNARPCATCSRSTIEGKSRQAGIDPKAPGTL